MAGDEERLIVLLEARIRDFEKNMQKASGTADKSYGRMRKDSKSATAAMEQDMIRSTSRINQALAATSTKIGAYGKAAIGGFLGGFVAGGVAGVVSQIGQVANSIAQVGDEARRAGVSVQAFQEWKFVAEQNRIGIDQMTDGLKELNLRADEFVQTGKGSAAEAFQRLGYSAGELAEKLKDPSALMLEIIDRLGKFDKAAQIRISDELFGGSAGERFVELIDQGEAGIRRTIDRAHDLGLVMDEELVKRAAEIDRRFNEIANTVGMKLKSAIVSAADSLVDFINSFRAFENQRSTALEAQVNDIMRQRATLVEELRALQTGSDLTDNARDLGFGPATETAKQQIAEVQAAIDALTARENEIIGILSDRTSEQLPKTGDRTWTPPPPPPGGFGSNDAERAAKELERQREMLQRRLDLVQQYLISEAEMTTLAQQLEVERATAHHEKRLEDLNASLEAGLITKQRFNEMEQALEDQHENELTRIKQEHLDRRTQAEIDYLNFRDQAAHQLVGLLGMMGQESRAAAIAAIALNKGLMIAQTIQNTAAAAAAALAPPPLGLGPIAGAALAARTKLFGALQVATIAGTGLMQAAGTGRGGGSFSGGGGSGGSIGGGASAEPPRPQQAITINLEGQMYSRQSVEDLIKEINDAQRDGYAIIHVGN